MRQHAYAASRRAVRWLNRIAPRLVNFVATVIRHELERSHPAAAPIVVPISSGDVRFTLVSTERKGEDDREWYNVPLKRYVGNNLYEPLMLACLTRLLQRAPAPRFMDIGAYLGYYACYVSALLGGRHEVYAIESNPAFADAIREAARVNGFKHLKVFQAALSDRIEQVCIDGVTVRHDAQPQETSVTLDKLCEQENLKPSIIKIDVHGAEGKVILGMRATLAEVECVLLEVHKLPLLQEYSPGITRTAMLDTLEDAGLTLYYVAGHSGRDTPDFGELLAGKGYSYRRLDRPTRNLLLFDRSHDEFILALRHVDIESLLGPNVTPANE